MSKLVSISLLLLFLSVLVSAYPYVKAPGVLYEIQYSILSNGTDALVHLSVLQWGIECGMTNCWPAVFYGYEYLLYFNNYQLYLLNFTPVLGTPYVEYKGASFLNGSWYVEISNGVDRFYRLDTRHFCIEPANASWFWLPRGKVSDSIDGWQIELQSLGPGGWSHTNVSDVWVTKSKNVSSWSPGPATVANSSVFPIYFTLKKDNLTRNIALIYLNTSGNDSLIQGFWFPKSVKIVNVTTCRSATTPEDIGSNKTMTSTTVQNATLQNISITAKNATTTPEGRKSICGPGLITLLTLISLTRRRL
jgi:hypothetical protein